MDNLRYALRGLFRDATGASPGDPSAMGDYADRAIELVQRRYVEQAVAGAAIGGLPPKCGSCARWVGRDRHELANRQGYVLASDTHDQKLASRKVWRRCRKAGVMSTADAGCFSIGGRLYQPKHSIPIASVGPFADLAGDVARKLLDPTEWQTGEPPPTCADCGQNPPCELSEEDVAYWQEVEQQSICFDFVWRDPPFAAAYATLSDGSTEWVLVSAECERCKGSGSVGHVDCGACVGVGAHTDLAPIVKPYGGTVDENDPRLARFRVRVR